MSVTAAWRAAIQVAAVVTSLVCIFLLLGAIDAAFAQAGPFGAGPQPSSPAAGGLTGWIMAKQAEFYRMLSGSIRAAKNDGSAVAGLFGISFLYGVFHAAGPGHGKAVISSYLVANNETWRRGVVLSFASAVLQALVAIALVGIASVVLGVTAQKICGTNYIIEIASYAIIAAVGARLLWVKGRAFVAALRPPAADHDHHDHHHHHHDEAACDHAHGPEPKELAGPGGWGRGLSAVLAVGVRPCSGAIIVLVFALAQGLFWAGVGATFVMGLGTAITVAAIATIAVGARALAG
ncbi:MAG: nickel/cobalt transporter (NicO) family protein, partial [Alphaproteobacteria bacterium]|nr:nickel/cobalt transporter (NicO) family protein [Alphaproteobacteria bacterium]